MKRLTIPIEDTLHRLLKKEAYSKDISINSIIRESLEQRYSRQQVNKLSE